MAREGVSHTIGIIDAPMQKSLLGMSFLRKLAGFAVKDEQLILRW